MNLYNLKGADEFAKENKLLYIAGTRKFAEICPALELVVWGVWSPNIVWDGFISRTDDGKISGIDMGERVRYVQARK